MRCYWFKWFCMLSSLCGALNQVAPQERVFFVTGASGVLGRHLVGAIHHGSFSSPRNVWIGVRPERVPATAAEWPDRTVVPVEIDARALVDTPRESTSMQILPPHLELPFNCSEMVVINCLGVCQHGCTLDSAVTSLGVNALAPIRITQSILNLVQMRTCQRIERSVPLATTIINISSGEGELALLNTELQSQIMALGDLEEWETLLRGLATGARWNEGREVAFGDTPWYSVSKAMLNAGTRLQQQAFEEAGVEEGTKYMLAPVRVMALCPGDFASPMTTIADLLRMEEHTCTQGEVLDSICAAILDVAVGEGAAHYRGGNFYRPTERKAEPLPW